MGASNDDQAGGVPVTTRANNPLPGGGLPKGIGVESVTLNDSTQYAGGGNAATGYTITTSDGRQINIQNPGNVNLANTNPELWAEIQRLRYMRDSADLDQYFDPSRLDARRNEAMDRNSTAMMNHFSAMGLGGSSVASGAMAEGARQTGFAFDDRQQMEELRALQMELMMTGGIEKSILAGQAGYGGFQGQYLNTILGLEGMEAQSDAANAQMWGSILGAVGSIGGAFVGGPAGAMAGGALGNAAGSGAAGSFQYGNTGSMVPTAYNSPNFGTIGGDDYAPGYF